jgi:hypothetical protein
LKSQDPDEDQVRFVLELRRGEVVKRYETELVGSGSEATFTVTEDLESGRWSWRAKAIDSKGGESDWSEERFFTVNRVPNVPVLLEPADNAIVSPTPTFKLKSQDPDEDQVRFVLELRRGEVVKRYETELVGSGSEATFTVTEDLESGRWSWRAKAIDSKGGESDWSEERFFTVNRVPNVPVLLEPADNAIVSPTPTFKLKSQDPDEDQVRFVLELRRGEVVKRYETELVGSGSEATFTVTEDLESGRWSWRAKAIDSKGGESDWSEERFFTVNRVPNVPVLLEPADNAIVSPTPTFKLKSQDPDEDQVRFVLELRRGEVVKRYETELVGSGSEATFTVTEELESGRWSWKAKAIDSKGGESDWSEERFFTVNRVPNVPVLLEPADNAIVSPTPTFKLKSQDPDEDQVRFVLELRRGEVVKRYETELVGSGSEATFTVTEDLESGRWSWRAKAIDSKGGESDWSEERFFTVNRVPNVPVLLEPADNAIVSPTPTFKLKSQDPDEDQVRFVLELRRGEVVKRYETELVGSGSEATFTVTEDLESGRWSWRAKAIDSKGGESDWSEERFFTVNRVPNVPVLLEPADNAIVSPTPTFKLKSQDPDEDQVRFVLELRRGEVVKRYETELVGSGSEATFTVTEELESGRWSWRAKAIDSKGEASDWSPAWTFTVQVQVAKPDLVPKDLTLSASEVEAGGKVTVRFKVVNQGQAKANPSKTDVRLSPSPDRPTRDDPLLVSFDTPALDPNQSVTHETEVTIPLENPLGDYYIWVIVDADKTVGQSDESNDYLKAPLKVVETPSNRPPSIPNLLSPSDGSIVSPTPKFRVKVTDPDGDRVKAVIELRFFSPLPQFAEFKSFESDFVSSGQEVTVTIPTDQELGSGEWTWRAKAVDEHGQESGYSEVRVIIVNRPPSIPELIEPEDNAVVPSIPTFKIKTVDPEDDSVMFMIELRQGATVKELKTEWTMPVPPPIKGGTPQEVTYTPAEPLGSGRWTWRVKAVDNKGAESEWSVSKTFIIQVTVSNHPPTIPVVLTPPNNVVTSPTPTFQVKAEDQDGDRLKYRFVFKQGQQTVLEFETTDTFESGQVVTLRLPENQALRSGVYQWQVLAFDGKEWSQPSEIRTFTVSNAVPRRVRGLGTFGLSLQTETLTREALGLVGLPMKFWNPSIQRYQDVGDTLEIGKGYWFKARADFPIALAGRLLTEEVFIPLQKGWNFISNPYLQEVVWDVNAIWVWKNGFLETLEQAQQAGWIEDYAWGWEQDANNPDTGRYVLVYDTSIIPGVKGQLEPWKGYWVYAHTDCELILPPPSQSKGRGTRGEGRVAKGNGWSMRLQASVNGSVGEAVIGIANGTRGLAVGLPPEPPTGNNGVQVILLKNNTPLAVDVRNDGSRRQEWEVLVRFGTRDGGRGTSERKEVVLTFDGIGYAPKDVSAWLVDTVTGKRVYLRTQPSYRFAPEVGETERRFKVIVESGNERPLRIVGLKATPMRGEGLVITFALTKPAQVRGEVMTLTGRKIAVMDEGSTRMAGMHRMIWRGVGSEGVKVPVGAYLVRLVATDEDGRQVQAVTVVRSR